MGRCNCGKDAGWFNYVCCEAHEITFGKKVEIKDGFYKKQQGIVNAQGWNCADGTIGYKGDVKCFKVKLDCGKEVYFNDFDLKVV